MTPLRARKVLPIIPYRAPYNPLPRTLYRTLYNPLPGGREQLKWLKFAKFEIKNGTPLRAREVINFRGDQL